MSLWPLRVVLAQGRPHDASFAARAAIVALLVGGFLVGDYRLFRKVFAAARRIEELTPMFALGLIENFLGLVFLVGTFVLFFSAMTASIGSLFTDLDLEIWHASPTARVTIALQRLGRTLIQSSYLVVLFLVPLILALQHEMGELFGFTLAGTAGLLLLLATPVCLASTAILLLVRFFPVRRVQQISVTLAILVLTTLVVGLRMARPERLFAEITTDDVVAVLQAIRLPEAERLPSSWLAGAILAWPDEGLATGEMLRLAVLAGGALALFVAAAWRGYFPAWTRSRESSAPVAIGAGLLTRALDRLLRHAAPQTRAMLGKETRVVTRDAAQWSQLFMMVALLFLYLYNIQMIPLEGDFRAAILAWLNLGMSGFVIAAICLRFAYPSLSAERRQFWILESAPISFRRILWTKVAVYLAPLLLLGLLLTVLANLLLDASGPIWAWTIGGSALTTASLVCMGVGMGAITPDLRSENPMEVALSLGGLAFMALSMLYVGLMMFLLARPLQRLLLRLVFGMDLEQPGWLAPVGLALAVSLAVSLVPIELAVRRFGSSDRF
ncbi:MAG TPA: hypothetical protein VMS56_10220 [Thermoanaerobaculia bacterium]|nr:hypothetical protein [Thermoanaerobaculia bacterium]